MCSTLRSMMFDTLSIQILHAIGECKLRYDELPSCSRIKDAFFRQSQFVSICLHKRRAEDRTVLFFINTMKLSWAMNRDRVWCALQDDELSLDGKTVAKLSQKDTECLFCSLFSLLSRQHTHFSSQLFIVWRFSLIRGPKNESRVGRCSLREVIL